MAISETKVEQLISTLTRLTDAMQNSRGSLYPSGSSGIPSTVMNTVPDPSTMPLGFRALQTIAPYAGHTAPLTYVAPRQSLSDAQFMSGTGKTRADALNDHASAAIAKRFGGTLDAMGTNFGLADTGTFSKLAEESAGQAVTRAALGNKLLQDAIGGNAYAGYETAGRLGPLLGTSSSEILDFDSNTNAQQGSNIVLAQKQFGDAFTDAMMTTTTGADGSKLVTPNMSFTRGFSYQDLSSMYATSAMRGGEGDIGRERNEAFNKDLEAETTDFGRDELKAGTRIGINTQALLDKATGRMGEMAKMFEALGEISGSTEYSDLQSEIDALTNGTYGTSRGPSAEELRVNLREMAAAAKLGNTTPQALMSMTLGAASHMQGMEGITDADRALGYTGTFDAQVIATDALRKSKANDINDTRGQQQVLARHTGLMMEAVDSRGVRGVQALEYLDQTGTFTDNEDKANNDRLQAEYASLKETMANGTKDQMNEALGKIATHVGGGNRARGEDYLNDDVLMRNVAGKLDDSRKKNVTTITGQGVQSDAMSIDERHTYERLRQDITDNSSGMGDVYSSDAAADAGFSALTKGLTEVGRGHAVASMTETYNASVGKMSRADALMAAQQSVRGLRHMGSTIQDAIIEGSDAARTSEASKVVFGEVEGAADYYKNTTLTKVKVSDAGKQGMSRRAFVGGDALEKLRAAQSAGLVDDKEYRRIYGMLETDPLSALKAIDAILEGAGEQGKAILEDSNLSADDRGRAISTAATGGKDSAFEDASKDAQMSGAVGGEGGIQSLKEGSTADDRVDPVGFEQATGELAGDEQNISNTSQDMRQGVVGLGLQALTNPQADTRTGLQRRKGIIAQMTDSLVPAHIREQMEKDQQAAAGGGNTARPTGSQETVLSGTLIVVDKGAGTAKEVNVNATGVPKG